MRTTDSVTPEEKERNKELISRFPFLMPRHVWTDTLLEDYDYEFTLMDDIPYGWRVAFGEQMCQEIMDELVASHYADAYRVVQIKEKYGGLRWYDNGAPTRLAREILPKYEDLSEHTCIHCGKPAKYVSRGWILPFCEDCIKLEQLDVDEYDVIDW